MSEPNEDRINREEIIEAANSLIRLCEKHKIAVSGFIWGAKPAIILNFGNIKEQRDMPALSKLYLDLCSVVEDRVTEGTFESRHADRLQ